MLGKVVETRLARALDAALPRSLPPPTAVLDWVTLYVRPPGSLSGFVNPVRRAVW